MKTVMEIEIREEVYEFYEVIFHFKGIVIVEDEMGDLFFIRGTGNEAPIGTVVSKEGLQPFHILNKDTKKRIMKKLRGGV